MKKLLAMLLALTLVLSMGVAMAEGETGGGEGTGGGAEKPVYSVGDKVQLPKHFVLLNADTSNPAATFTFTFAAESVSYSECTVEQMPPMSPATVLFEKGSATTTPGTRKTAEVTIPKFTKPGIYYYKITESTSTLAGVSTDTQTAQIVFSVQQDETSELGIYVDYIYFLNGDSEKVGVEDTNSTLFKNEYKAGSLQITKTVVGDYGEYDKYFDITVKLTAPQGKTSESVTVSGGQYDGVDPAMVIPVDGEEHTLKIKHDDMLTLANIPYDVEYEVVEGELAPYTRTYVDEKNSGVIESSAASVGIINTTIDNPETGISLDDVPYIVLLAVAVLGIAALLLKKRFAANHD